MKGMFDRDALCRAILGFLQEGPDVEDRAECVRIALGRINRRSQIVDVISQARSVLDWPPKPKVVLAPAKKKATKKKAGKKKGPFTR
jgi:hypothetical protein